jgi:hypothetical protein
MKKVVIEILPDGSSKVDAQGFKGSQCSLATRELELALAGSGPVDDRKKPDFYAQNSQTQADTGR